MVDPQSHFRDPEPDLPRTRALVASRAPVPLTATFALSLTGPLPAAAMVAALVNNDHMRDLLAKTAAYGPDHNPNDDIKAVRNGGSSQVLESLRRLQDGFKELLSDPRAIGADYPTVLSSFGLVIDLAHQRVAGPRALNDRDVAIAFEELLQIEGIVAAPLSEAFKKLRTATSPVARKFATNGFANALTEVARQSAGLDEAVGTGDGVKVLLAALGAAYAKIVLRQINHVVTLEKAQVAAGAKIDGLGSTFLGHLARAFKGELDLLRSAEVSPKPQSMPVMTLLRQCIPLAEDLFDSVSDRLLESCSGETGDTIRLTPDERMDCEIILSVGCLLSPTRVGPKLYGCIAMGDLPDDLATTLLCAVQSAVAQDGVTACNMSDLLVRALTIADGSMSDVEFHHLCRELFIPNSDNLLSLLTADDQKVWGTIKPGTRERILGGMIEPKYLALESLSELRAADVRARGLVAGHIGHVGSAAAQTLSVRSLTSVLDVDGFTKLPTGAVPAVKKLVAVHYFELLKRGLAEDALRRVLVHDGGADIEAFYPKACAHGDSGRAALFEIVMTLDAREGSAAAGVQRVAKLEYLDPLYAAALERDRVVKELGGVRRECEMAQIGAEEETLMTEKLKGKVEALQAIKLSMPYREVARAIRNIQSGTEGIDAMEQRVEDLRSEDGGDGEIKHRMRIADIRAQIEASKRELVAKRMTAVPVPPDHQRLIGSVTLAFSSIPGSIEFAEQELRKGTAQATKATALKPRVVDLESQVAALSEKLEVRVAQVVQVLGAPALRGWTVDTEMFAPAGAAVIGLSIALRVASQRGEPLGPIEDRIGEVLKASLDDNAARRDIEILFTAMAEVAESSSATPLFSKAAGKAGRRTVFQIIRDEYLAEHQANFNRPRLKRPDGFSSACIGPIARMFAGSCLSSSPEIAANSRQVTRATLGRWYELAKEKKGVKAFDLATLSKVATRYILATKGVETKNIDIMGHAFAAILSVWEKRLGACGEHERKSVLEPYIEAILGSRGAADSASARCVAAAQQVRNKLDRLRDEHSAAAAAKLEVVNVDLMTPTGVGPIAGAVARLPALVAWKGAISQPLALSGGTREDDVDDGGTAEGDDDGVIDAEFEVKEPRGDEGSQPQG